MVSKVKIKINDLYKIFGPKGESHVEKVKSGMGKPELLEKHSHVLGLQNINFNFYFRHHDLMLKKLNQAWENQSF